MRLMRVAVVAGLLISGSFCGANASDGSGERCKPATATPNCLLGEVAVTAVNCELTGKLAMMRLELGEVSFKEVFAELSACANEATKSVTSYAKPLQKKLAKKSDALSAMKDLRVAHKMFVEGLAPDGDESKLGYRTRVSRLRQTLGEKKAAFELEVE